MDFAKDYYRILNVSPKATFAELKSAYRMLAKRYHPDLNPGDAECEAHIKEVNEAWEILGNSENRFIYDAFKESELKEKERQQQEEKQAKQKNAGSKSPSHPNPKKKTYTKKQWVAHEERFYISGELLIKYRGTQDDDLTDDVLKEVFYNLRQTDVRAKIQKEDIHRGSMPDHFRTAFTGQKVPIQVPQPVKSAVVSGQSEQHYLLNIFDLTIPSVSIRDVTKDDGDSFGTLTGIFYGYISITTYTEEEAMVTECYGETGRKETKVEGNQRFGRKEYYHADCSTYWSKWAPAGSDNKRPATGQPKAHKPASFASTGCTGTSVGCLPYLIVPVFLILLLPKLILLWPLVLFFLVLWLISARRWSGIFGLISVLSLCFFLFSLFGTFRHKPAIPAPAPEKPAETRLVRKPLPASHDTLITRYRSWTDYDGKIYEGKYTVRQSSLRAASRYKQHLDVTGDDETAYDEMLGKLAYQDQKQLSGLYGLLDKIRERDHLDRKKFAEMFVTMVQDIPYTIVLPMACDSGLYHDRFISSYLARADARCDENQRFGINTPVEFLAGLNGDCDTRTLLIYTVLSHYGYHVALLSSSQYSHSLIGIDLPYEGTAYESTAGRFILWETTSRAQPGLLPNDINNLNYWRISLISKS